MTVEAAPIQKLARLAQAEAKAHARYGLSREFGPLVAVYAGPDLPLNTAWHDGTQSPSEADLNRFEAFSLEHGQAPTLQLLSHAAASMLPTLRARGYALDYVLHAYTHDLQALPVVPNIPIQEQDDADAWAALSARGFGPGSEAIMQLVSRAPHTRRFVAILDGQAVATAAMSLTDGVAACFGTSTLPDFRGRGVQTALLAHRLRQAAEAGADLASVFVTPATPSERNIQRAGFTLAGSRLTFSRKSR